MSSLSLSSIPTDRQMDRFRVVGRFINNDNTNGMKGDIIAQGTCHHVVCQAFPQTDRLDLGSSTKDDDKILFQASPFIWREILDTSVKLSSRQDR